MANSSEIKDFLRSVKCCLANKTVKDNNAIKHGACNPKCRMIDTVIESIFFSILADSEGSSDQEWAKFTITNTFEKIGNFPIPWNTSVSYIIESSDNSKNKIFFSELIIENDELSNFIDKTLLSIKDNCCVHGLYSIAEKIDNDSCLYTIYYDKSWVEGSFSNYLQNSVIGIDTISTYIIQNNIDADIEIVINPFNECLTDEQLCKMRTFLDRKCKECP